MGVFTIRLRVAEPGAGSFIRLYFLPSPLDDAILYYKFDTANGWADYSGYIETGDDPACLTVELVDGGFGDADGVANGIIVDLLGPPSKNRAIPAAGALSAV